MVTILTFAGLSFVLFTILVGYICYYRGYHNGAMAAATPDRMSKNVASIAQKQVKKIPPHLSFGYAVGPRAFSPEPVIEDAVDDANIYYAKCPFCDAPMGNGQMKCTRCGKWTWEDT